MGNLNKLFAADVNLAKLVAFGGKAMFRPIYWRKLRLR